MNNSPIIEVDGMRFLNVPSARELIQEVIVEDCYELRSLSTSRIFIDLGAAFGEAAMFASSLGMLAVAVEPSPDNFAVLEANCGRNSRNPLILNLAVAAQNGVIDFWSRSDHPAGSSACLREGEGKLESIESMTVLSIIGAAQMRFGNALIALKFDIEGSERAAFESADEWLPLVDFVSMEFHGGDGEDYEVPLIKHGFSVKLTGTGPPPRPPWDRSMQGGLVIARRTSALPALKALLASEK